MLDGLLARIAASRRHERRFADEVAHELRTPLAALRGRAELALLSGDEAESEEALRAAIEDTDRMSRTIDTLLARLDLPGEDASPGRRPAAAVAPVRNPAPRGDDAVSSRTDTMRPLKDVLASPVRKDATPPERDPLTADCAAKVLYSVDLMDGPSASRSMSRFRLEPWEVRSAKRLLSDAPPANDAERARDLLFFESALVRIRIDEEAQQLRGAESNGALPQHLATSAQCLVRAQDLDRRFRAELDVVTKEQAPERVKEVNRSRFRLLRSFSGLWLLHDSKSAG